VCRRGGVVCCAAAPPAAGLHRGMRNGGRCLQDKGVESEAGGRVVAAGAGGGDGGEGGDEAGAAGGD